MPSDPVFQPLTPGVPDARRADQSPGERLGPVLLWRPLEGVAGRFYATGVAVIAVVLLVTAAGIAPDGRHMGTHRQLGLPACGFAVVTGFPCPTCGMTTAFAYTVRGQVADAVIAQPAGFVLAVSTMAAAILALWAAVGGRIPSINWYRVDPLRLVWIGIGLLVLSWFFKLTLGILRGEPDA